MRLATCRHCEQPLLHTHGICPRCEEPNSSSHWLAWTCTVVSALGVAAAAAVKFAV